MNGLIGQMAGLVQAVEKGTASRADRDRLRDLRNQVRDLINNVKAGLQRDNGDPNRHEKLAQNFRSALELFDGINKRVMKVETMLLEEVQSKSRGTMGPMTRTQPSATLERQRQDTLSAYGLKTIDEVDARIIQETNRDIQALNQDLNAVQDVLKDFNSLLVQQGEQLRQVETNTSNAAVHVEQAREELRVGEKLKNSIRKKKVIIAAIIICVLVALAIFLGIYFGR